MLATCEKRPMSPTSNMVHCKRLPIALALLCVLPIATLSQTVATTPNPPPPLGMLVDVGGYRVHLYCTGAGSPTVVIVSAGFSFNWGLVQPEVANLLRFVRMTTPESVGVTTVRKIHVPLGRARFTPR